MELFGGTQIEANKRNLVRNVIAWIGWTTDSNNIEVIVLDNQKFENWEEFERRVWLFICTIVRYYKYTREYGHGEMRNK